MDTGLINFDSPPTPPVHSDYYEGTVLPTTKIDERSFLGDSLSEEYTPQMLSGIYGFVGLMNRNRPPFSYWMIRDMICDPRVLLGLWLLKGPLVSKFQMTPECSNTQAADFILQNFQRFYRNSAHRVLKALEWGYSASEVLYRYNGEDGLIHFDRVKDFDSLDCRPVVHRGNIIGFRFRISSDPWGGTEYNRSKPDKDGRPGWRYAGAPRSLWHLHWRERNPYFGVSRLFGVHVPWWEKWSEDGFRNIRRLWFLKCAFDGGVMYHPSGTIATKDRGPLPARDYARELIEKKRTGAVLTLPNTMAGTDGSVRAWEYVPPQGNPTPAGLIEYGESLDQEILEAFGIPPGVFSSQGAAGSDHSIDQELAGDAFHAALHELNLNLCSDFDSQCMRYLVQYLFGVTEYELIVEPIGSVTASPPLPRDEQGNPLMTDPTGEPEEEAAPEAAPPTE